MFSSSVPFLLSSSLYFATYHLVPLFPYPASNQYSVAHIQESPSINFWKMLTRGHAYWISREGVAGKDNGRKTSMWEKNMDWRHHAYTPNRDWTPNLGMCPGHESNLHSSGLWISLQPSEPHWLGLKSFLYRYFSMSEENIFYSYLLYLFFKDFISLFLERGEQREKEKERSINVCLTLTWPHW